MFSKSQVSMCLAMKCDGAYRNAPRQLLTPLQSSLQDNGGEV